MFTWIWIWWLNHSTWDETHTNNRTCTSLSGLFVPGLSDRDEDEEPAWWPKVVCWDLVNDLACQDDTSRNHFLYLFLDYFALILEIHHRTSLLRSSPWASRVFHINRELTRSSREELLGLHLVVISNLVSTVDPAVLQDSLQSAQGQWENDGRL